MSCYRGAGQALILGAVTEGASGGAPS